MDVKAEEIPRVCQGESSHSGYCNLGIPTICFLLSKKIIHELEIEWVRELNKSNGLESLSQSFSQGYPQQLRSAHHSSHFSPPKNEINLNSSGNYACIYMSFNIKWHIDTLIFFIRHINTLKKFIRHINTTFFLKWHINTKIKLSDIHMFYKWQHMSFNINKTYIHISYFIYMSHKF